MITTKNNTVFITADDIQKNYTQYKGKRIKISALIKRSSVRCSFIIAETHKGDLRIRIPKRYQNNLIRLNNLVDIDTKVRVIVEGEPYFNRHEESLGVKQGNILEIYDTIKK
jgi:hypothetical protein